MTKDDISKIAAFDFDTYFKQQKPVQRIAETPPLKLPAIVEANAREKRSKEADRYFKQLR